MAIPGRKAVFCIAFLACWFAFAQGQLPNSSTSPASPLHPPASAGMFDGPAELPRVHMATSVASTPAPGKLRKVKASDDPQAALNAAGCGDTIALPAGATFNGTIKLPPKPCDDSHWIILRTQAPDANLPAEGTRITPCYAGITSLHGLSLRCASQENVMARIVGQPPILIEPGANHYRLIGLELTQIPGKIAYSILNISDAADHIVVDRCWIHGTTFDDSQLGVRFNSSYLALVDSFISDIHFKGADSQAVGGTGGTGPYAIVGNYLEAAGENVMFGGGAATTTPSDIEIRRNHFYKPLTWRPEDPSFAGVKYTVKDLFEIKNAQRVLLEGNILENMWGGTAVVITPKSQNGMCPICAAADITFRYNIVRHAGDALTVANAPSASGAVAQPAQRVSIHDSLFEDIDADKWHDGGRVFLLGECPQCQMVQDVSIHHNTATEGPRNFLFINDPGKRPMSHFVFTDNIVPHGKYGVVGCDQTPDAILANCFTAPVFSKNLIVGDDGKRPYPSGQLFAPDWRHVKLVGSGAGLETYRLAEDSKYKKAGTDGADLGANLDQLAAATAGVAQW